MIRNQVSSLDHFSNFQPQRISQLDMLAKHIASRYMRKTKPLNQQFGLRAFSRTRRPKEDNRCGCRRDLCLAQALDAAPAAPDTARFRSEALVVTHDQLRLHLIHRVHRDANND